MLVGMPHAARVNSGVMAEAHQRVPMRAVGYCVRRSCMLRAIGLVATVLAFGRAWRVFRRHRSERIACLVMFVLQVSIFALWLSGMLAVSLGRGPSWLPGGAVLDPRVQRVFQTVCLWGIGLSAAVFPIALGVRLIQWVSVTRREAQTVANRDSGIKGDSSARGRVARILAESAQVLFSATARWLKSAIHGPALDKETDAPAIKAFVLTVLLELTALGAIYVLHGSFLPGFEAPPRQATSPSGRREVLLVSVRTPDHSSRSYLLLHRERGGLLCRPGGLFHHGGDSASYPFYDATCVWSEDSQRVQVWVRLKHENPKFACAFYVDCAQNRLLPRPKKYRGLAQLTAASGSESE